MFKSKVMIFEKNESVVLTFAHSHRIGTECNEQCVIRLNEQIMKKVSEFE